LLAPAQPTLSLCLGGAKQAPEVFSKVLDFIVEPGAPLTAAFCLFLRHQTSKPFNPSQQQNLLQTAISPEKSRRVRDVAATAVREPVRVADLHIQHQ
jgi:hypothetical protein